MVILHRIQRRFFHVADVLPVGLFVSDSIQRKGVGRFPRDRLLRLGLPLVVAAAIVAPLAYYPTYLLMPALAGGTRRSLRIQQK